MPRARYSHRRCRQAGSRATPVDATAHALMLDTAALAPGAHVVDVEVSDPTIAVRYDPTGVLADRARWTFIVPLRESARGAR